MKKLLLIIGLVATTHCFGAATYNAMSSQKSIDLKKIADGIETPENMPFWAKHYKKADNVLSSGILTFLLTSLYFKMQLCNMTGSSFTSSSQQNKINKLKQKVNHASLGTLGLCVIYLINTAYGIHLKKKTLLPILESSSTQELEDLIAHIQQNSYCLLGMPINSHKKQMLLWAKAILTERAK